MLGPNEFDALKAALPAQIGNTTNNEALNRRRRQTGIETPLVQAADTAQFSKDAVNAAQQAAQKDFSPLAPGPIPGATIQPATFVPAPRVLNVGQIAAQPAGAPATDLRETAPDSRTLADSWASSPTRNAIGNEPEVRPGRVSEAVRSLASLSGQDSGAVNARISEKFLTGF